MPKISLPGSYKFRRVFSIVALADVNDGGTPYMDISPARTHASTRGRARASFINALHPAALLHGTHSGRMSLKKCVFGSEEKITLFSFPNNPALRQQWMQFIFPGQQRSFSSVFVDERFINKAQVDVRFAHGLILKDGAVPAIKDPGHDSELLAVNESASNVRVLLVIALKCSSLFSSAHGAPPPGARLFSESIIKLYLSLINIIKTKDFLEI